MRMLVFMLSKSRLVLVAWMLSSMDTFMDEMLLKRNCGDDLALAAEYGDGVGRLGGLDASLLLLVSVDCGALPPVEEAEEDVGDGVDSVDDELYELFKDVVAACGAGSSFFKRLVSDSILLLNSLTFWSMLLVVVLVVVIGGVLGDD